MKSKKQTVNLREKKLKSGEISLYLDIWFKGKRHYEFLKLYIVPPKNSRDRELNRTNYLLAESIRAKRQLEIKNNEYGFQLEKGELYFLDYFASLIEKRSKTKSNYDNWKCAFKHLKKYADPKLKLSEVNSDFALGFKKFLSKIETNGRPLAQNSQYTYYNKFKAAINQASQDGLIRINPIKSIKGVAPEDVHREYLTFDELKSIIKADCKYPNLKKAFIFCCLTGIRWSDVQKMEWKDIRDEDNGSRLVFRQYKTGGQEYLDINNQARDLLGKRQKSNDRVIKGLKYSTWFNFELKRWLLKAGITKDITFHCSRHTFAVLQLELGTDIYTVSKLLGHKHLKTTEIYAKVVDKTKREAVNKIPNLDL